jgi:uncharacterized protein
VMRGPRQIGKTTLQFQVIEQLLESGVEPQRILRVQFDELPAFRATTSSQPILDIVDWYASAILNSDLNAMARAGRPALLFLDEVQNLGDWDVQLKALVDRTSVRILVTGSSALRIEMGRDSLAGRIQTLEVGPFRLWEIAQVRKLSDLKPFTLGNGTGEWARASFWRDLKAYGETHASERKAAFKLFSERGGYPLAHKTDADWNEVAQQLNETVVRRVIQHDLRVGERGRRRDARLLEEVFRMAARYCGQAPSLATLAQHAHEALEANVGVQRVAAYVAFLDNSLLLRAVEPLEMRLKRRRGAPKYCLSDHALRAAWLDEVVPLDEAGLEQAPELADLAGRVAESCVGYFFASIGLPVAYLPERKDAGEIDFVVTAGDQRVPIEVKFQRRIDPVRDTKALQQYMAKPVNRAPIGVIVTRGDDTPEMPANVVAVPLSTLLLAR